MNPLMASALGFFEEDDVVAALRLRFLAGGIATAGNTVGESRILLFTKLRPLKRVTREGALMRRDGLHTNWIWKKYWEIEGPSNTLDRLLQ